MLHEGKHLCNQQSVVRQSSVNLDAEGLSAPSSFQTSNRPKCRPFATREPSRPRSDGKIPPPEVALPVAAGIFFRARRTGNGQNRDGRGEPCEAMHGSGRRAGRAPAGDSARAAWARNRRGCHSRRGRRWRECWLRRLPVRVPDVQGRLFVGTRNTEFSPPKGLGWRSGQAGSGSQRSSTTKRYS